MKKESKAEVEPRRQRTQYTCMATSLAMCFSALGHDIPEDEINKVLGARAHHGAGWEDALNTAQYFGKRCVFVMPCTIEQLKEWTDASIPVLIAWNPEGRPWSHASVVFDVSHDLDKVYIADPNIPDPDETVRIITKDEFYKRWFENAGDHLIRRPAIAVMDEISKDGKPMNKIPNKVKKASSLRFSTKPYSGNPDNKPIYPVEIDHGVDKPLSGGTDVVLNLSRNLVKEQGREASSEEKEDLFVFTTGNNYFRKAEPGSKMIASEPSYWRDFIEEGDSWKLTKFEGVPSKVVEKILTYDINPKYKNGYDAFEDLIKNCANFETITNQKQKRTAGTGLYGYNKNIERAVIGCTKRMEKQALRIAKRYFKKDERVANFLSQHAKKAGSLPAQILTASLKSDMPKFASFSKDATKYGLYGFSEKTANLGLMACLELRHQAGIIAYDLHQRKKEEGEYIRGFIDNHCKTARCKLSKLLKISYPED